MKNIENRSNLVKKLIKQCDLSKISNKSLGIIIRGFRISSPANILISLLFLPKKLFILTIIYLLVLLSFFIYFDGCLLTILERKLCGDDFTFIDPVLEAYDLELNNKNRFKASIMAAFGYLSLCFFIYYIRFGR